MHRALHCGTYSLLGANALSVINHAGNVIDGGADDDKLLGGSGADVVHRGGDNDFLEGLGGDDVLFDWIEDGRRDNTLSGGIGNDTMLGNKARFNEAAAFGGRDYINEKESDEDSARWLQLTAVASTAAARPIASLLRRIAANNVFGSAA